MLVLNIALFVFIFYAVTRMVRACESHSSSVGLLTMRLEAAQNETRKQEAALIMQMEETVKIRVELAAAYAQLTEKEKGREFDVHLLKTTIERVERYRRVLEAVLRAQGCDEQKIAFVVAKTEGDEPLEE